MKANVLRIGNYVSNEKGALTVIDGRSIFDLWSKTGILKYLPIPITEEWLLRFGFDKRRHSYDICDNWHYGINPITKDWLFCLKWIDVDDSPFYMNGHFEIKHVHQLQNLYFSLTGKELKLNEK